MIKSLAMPAFHEQHFVAGVTDDFPRGVRYVPAKQPLDEVSGPNAFDYTKQHRVISFGTLGT
jgi:hypothetical protein